MLASQPRRSRLGERMRPNSTRGRWIGAAALMLPLAATAPSAAAPKKVTGKLSEPGFTVIALDAKGEAASAQTKPNGTFQLKPPAKRVSLHLRGADGTYAGPVVI